jgi:predicted ATPase
MSRIVLTGGPGSGKTVISAQLALRDPARFVLVPEAATQVYDALQTRWDKLDLAGRRDVQRKIYQLQVAQENRIAVSHPGQVLLLDRGTIDGAAYWPEGPDAYWLDVSSSPQREFQRYNAVIWMESAAALGHEFYDGDASNFCRFEDAKGAIESGRLLQQLWAGHPNIKHVGAFANIDDKILAVREVIDGLVE